ncbi:MAG: hypothetical protein A2408_03855 [Candidatus Yonathbacteria bacterium RIFOXYC1_FULL_52_10]|uniref:Uncharacterized protein n=1 Tax=Candidatus Yonathbacteria bacterium RIFOXYD1_FULL_52_36 TaxID=1802730 RepID=A0A1G2SJD3_9BACT|nr:MAG: hypothetical protein A2408_03855 [Candidatus Yonathbacteria bacterium RIFOXYC1_FULL_52_10]OHA84852.1 MAG: hypothetical protein A2591_00805 [Candidatus Yonathbacteria bacterium RIFOXYD1_FULL_52_36]
MTQVVCRFCTAEIQSGARHHCKQMQEANHPAQIASDDEDSSDGFFVSLAVAAVTDNWMIGALVGGDLTGAAVGDMLFNDSDDDGSDSDFDSGD